PAVLLLPERMNRVGPCWRGSIGLLATLALSCSQSRAPAVDASLAPASPFDGAAAGAERVIAGVRMRWWPPGPFARGGPANHPERRPGEDQRAVTLTKGFWMAQLEATQGEAKRVLGALPGPLTAELPEGDDYPVGNVSFAEAEEYARRLTELARASG